MLRLAASLADQAPVSLGDAITGIDDRNVGLLIQAVLHVCGRSQSPDPPARLQALWLPGSTLGSG